jgi:hypothetical protein
LEHEHNVQLLVEYPVDAQVDQLWLTDKMIGSYLCHHF